MDKNNMHHVYELFRKLDNYFQLGIYIDDWNNASLVVNFNDNGFSSWGELSLNDYSYKKLKNDFSKFLKNKINFIRVNDDDSNEYYFSIERKDKYLHIEGIMGNYVDHFIKYSFCYLEDTIELIKLNFI